METFRKGRSITMLPEICNVIQEKFEFKNYNCNFTKISKLSKTLTGPNIKASIIRNIYNFLYFVTLFFIILE